MLEYRFYRKDPSSEDLILLHGFGGNSKIFYKQLKYYRQHFNVITIHLPGHGGSPSISSYTENFSNELATKEVIRTLDSLRIDQAHFIGVSLGSIIIHHLLKEYPERVKSAVLAGAITRFNFFSIALIQLAKTLKWIVPHFWLYYIVAHIIMPKSNHKNSRDTFIKEAHKMKRNDFLGWFNTLNKVSASYDQVPMRSKHIPKLYISGSEDHLFIKSLQQDIKQDNNATFRTIEKSGHVCNIDQHNEFNVVTLNFLKQVPETIKESS